MDIVDNIVKISKLLDDLDKFDESVPSKTQEYDYKISDLYHKLETMSLNSKNCYRFCKELKQVLIERRILKNDIVLINEFIKNKNKLINGIDNRQILLSNVGKTKKNLNSTYKNRIYTEEELMERIG